MRARRRFVVDADLAKPIPGGETLEETVCAPEAASAPLPRAATAGRKSPASSGIFCRRAPVDQRVEAMHRLAAQERFIVAMRFRGCRPRRSRHRSSG